MKDESKFHIAPPEPDISSDNVVGFDQSDIFYYRDFGDHLADIVRKVRTPLVFALTGGWGSGKSVFAKQWAGELRKQWAKNDAKNRKAEDAPVIYFDAFANDHQKSALFALAGEVMAFIGRRAKTADKLQESATQIAKGVGGVVAEGVARFATGGAAGVSEIAGAMESALTKRMKDAEEGNDAFREFRGALENAAKELSGDGQPLVFIVDELDRCRPDFALELLEKIKHLFSVPGVCFLVVTNLEQFKAVVQRAYGYNEKEARAYLDKFFHHAFHLPKGPFKAFDYAKYLLKHLELFQSDAKNNYVLSDLANLAMVHRLELRDIERIFTIAVLAVAAASGKEKFSHLPTFIIGLCVMRRVEPELYESAENDSLSWERVEGFMKFSEWATWGGGGESDSSKERKLRWAGAVKEQKDMSADERAFEDHELRFSKLTRLIEELEPRAI